VSVDGRIDFLPAASDEHTASKHLGKDIGHKLDLDDLLSPRDAGESGSISMRNAFGVKVNSEARAALLEALQRSVGTMGDESSSQGRSDSGGRTDSVVPGSGAGQSRAPGSRDQAEAVATPAPAQNQDWAVRTRSIPREELDDVLARRKSRVEARERIAPLHQQATTWADLRSAVQAFCRGAGIDPASLSPESQSMLPLIAGQLLREFVVGLNDVAMARGSGPAAKAVAAIPNPPGTSNPLRNSRSVEEAIQRLFESHGRTHAGPVDSLRDVMQDMKDHEAAVAAGMRAGLQATLGQLSPTTVADKFEQGRARMLAPGQDPRPKYWEHYADFYRLVTQQNGEDDLPMSFIEAFGQEYVRVRAALRAKRST
jgi:type VI secretion system protein